MRKLVIAGLLLTGLIAACETKVPVAPELSPTTSTTSSPTTTTSPTTSTSTTTTTAVLSSLAVKFAKFPPVANQPSEMTLLFELIPLLPAPLGGAAITTAAEPNNSYRVTGVYVMPNGTTGQVTGTLGNAVNPLVTGGDFIGTMTATTPTGCDANRPFTGRITPTTLTMNGGPGGSSECVPSPLAFDQLSMLRSDVNAPLPNPPPTSTSTSTTTSTCGYEVFPTSFNVPAAGGTFQVTIDTSAGCGWSAQSFADFITVLPPFGGTGDATVSFTVAQNATNSSRPGSLLIAGTTVTVTQAAATPPPAPPADLVPGIPPEGSCVFVPSLESWVYTINVNNIGGTAAGPSTTLAIFSLLPSSPTEPDVEFATGSVPANSTIPLQLAVPEDCFVLAGTVDRCSFTITVDSTAAVTEGNEGNNGPAAASCTRPIQLLRRR